MVTHAKNCEFPEGECHCMRWLGDASVITSEDRERMKVYGPPKKCTCERCLGESSKGATEAEQVEDDTELVGR